MAEPFRLPRVKVCGITRVEDAQVAVEAGADAIGIIQYPPSPRSIPALAAMRIAANLPSHVLRVGVMVDVTPAEAEHWCTQAGVHALQLCGTANPADWRSFPRPILRRIGVKVGAEEEMDAWEPVAVGFVLDHSSAAGGTGKQVPHVPAAALAAHGPCLLAGGLDEHNVASAIAAVHPAGVDASSRLEIQPGLKHKLRVRAYVEAARTALALEPA